MKRGFTIVELLIVLVVISIIAAITIVAYTGTTSKATIASIQADLTNNSKQIKLFYAQYGYYPTANNCPTPSSTEICLKTSSTNTTLSYVPGATSNAQTYSLVATNSTNKYQITSTSSPDTVPDIVTSGLVLNLDAGNTASYPGTGTTWTDLSGNGNNINLINAPIYTSSNSGGIVFNGTNQYLSNVSIPNPNGQMTVTVAINYNNKGSYHNIFDNNNANPMWWIRPLSQNSVFEVNTSSGLIGTINYSSQNIIAATTFSTSSPGLGLYVNGSLVQSSPAALSSWSNPINVTLLNRGGGQTFSGTLYILMIYNKVLSATEITQNFNALRGRYGI